MNRLTNKHGLKTYFPREYKYIHLVIDRCNINGFTKVAQITADLSEDLYDTKEYFGIPKDEILPITYNDYCSGIRNNNNIPIVIEVSYDSKLRTHEVQIKSIAKSDANAITIDMFRKTLLDISKKDDNGVLIHIDKEYIKDWKFFKFLFEDTLNFYKYKFLRKFSFDEINKSLVKENLSLAGVM